MNELSALLALCYLQAEGEVVLKGLIPDDDMDLLEKWLFQQLPDESESANKTIVRHLLGVLENKIKELKGEK